MRHSHLHKLGPRVALFLLLGGCEVGNGFASLEDRLADAGGSYGATTGDSLELLGESHAFVMRFSETREIAVTLWDLDGLPIAGGTVTFALQGDAGGSSLRDLEVSTDALGVARTFLSAGTRNSDFQVRAAALGAAPLFVSVSVRGGPIATLNVALEYSGTRPEKAREVSVYTGIPCSPYNSDAAQEEGDAAQDSSALLGRQSLAQGADHTILEIPAYSSSLTVIARALGALGEAVSRGCTLTDAPRDGSLSLSVTLRDLPMRLAGTYAVVAQLAVDESSEHLADALHQASAQILATPTSTALLNAVQKHLTHAGQEEASSKLRADRKSEGLDQALEGQLDSAGQGFTEGLEFLASELAARGAGLQVMSSLSAVGTGQLEFQYAGHHLTSTNKEGMQTLPLGVSPHSLPTVDPSTLAGSLKGQFDSAEARLAIDTLSLELGLGEYGTALLDALQREELHATTLRSLVGCGTFAQWVADQTELDDTCDQACREAACTQALDGLIEASHVALTELNVSHESIRLRGGVPLHDLNGDGVVDRTSQGAVRGSWGKDDDVDGTFEGRTEIP